MMFPLMVAPGRGVMLMLTGDWLRATIGVARPYAAVASARRETGLKSIVGDLGRGEEV